MKAKLTFIVLLMAALGTTPAEATVYDVLAQTYVSQQTGLVTGSLTGTITTDGTIGVGLSTSIVTGWNFFINDGTNPVVNLTTVNSLMTYTSAYGTPPLPNNLLSATPTELDLNFDGPGYQIDLEFTSSSNGAELVELFSASLFPGQSIQPGGMGIWTGGVDHPDVGLLVTYLSGTQAIATAETPLPAALPLFATSLGSLGLFGWRRKRHASKTQAQDERQIYAALRRGVSVAI